MSFRNSKRVSCHIYPDSINFGVEYKSCYLGRTITENEIKSYVSITPRIYKCLANTKNYNVLYSSDFILPVFQVIQRNVDKHYFMGLSVNCKIEHNNGMIHLNTTFTLPRDQSIYVLELSDEFLYIASVNLNNFLTDFAKTFRFSKDPNISFEEYFDSYYKSTNFASIIKNSDGKVLR